MPIFRCFHSPFVTGLFGSIFNPVSLSSAGNFSPQHKKQCVPYLPSEKMCDSPTSSHGSMLDSPATPSAALASPAAPAATHSEQAQPLSPHHQTGGQSPPPSLLPARESLRLQLYFLILVHLHCLPSEHLPPQPDGGPPDPPHPLHHPASLPALPVLAFPPGSPTFPSCCAADTTSLSGHQISGVNGEKNDKLFTLVYCFVFFTFL